MIKKANKEKIGPIWASGFKIPRTWAIEFTRRYWRPVKNFKTKPKNKNIQRERFNEIQNKGE